MKSQFRCRSRSNSVRINRKTQFTLTENCTEKVTMYVSGTDLDTYSSNILSTSQCRCRLLEMSPRQSFIHSFIHTLVFYVYFWVSAAWMSYKLWHDVDGSFLWALLHQKVFRAHFCLKCFCPRIRTHETLTVVVPICVSDTFNIFNVICK